MFLRLDWILKITFQGLAKLGVYDETFQKSQLIKHNGIGVIRTSNYGKQKMLMPSSNANLIDDLAQF